MSSIAVIVATALKQSWPECTDHSGGHAVAFNTVLISTTNLAMALSGKEYSHLTPVNC